MLETVIDKSKKSLYRVIADDIMDAINRNEFSFEKPLCTEKQLMEKYKISRITAKHAITELEREGVLYRKRGRGSFVSRNILSNQTKQNGDISKDTHIFAFILPFDITKGGIFETVQVLSNTLSAEGYYMCVYITDINNSRERSVLKQLMNQDLSGIVFYPSTNNYHLELLNKFALKDIPIVTIDKSNDCTYIHSVISDNYRGGIMLTEHLISLGHRNIAYLTRFGTAEISTIRDRFGGYLYALEQANITPRLEYVVRSDDIAHSNPNVEQAKSSVIDTVRTLYDTGFTAIEAENDEVAFSILLACRDLGIRVPEDMSICGFDNSEWAYMSDVHITTIKQDFARIGKSVADIFLSSSQTGYLQAEKVVVPVEMVVQQSTGPAGKS